MIIKINRQLFLTFIYFSIALLSVSCGPIQIPAKSGSILIGGLFTTVGGQPRSRIAMINKDGTLNNDFIPGLTGSDNFVVASVAFQKPEKILLGGVFSIVEGNGFIHENLVRVDGRGFIDPYFKPTIDQGVEFIILPDNNILIYGQFHQVNGQNRNNLARIYSNGNLDTTFNPNPDSGVFALAVQTDGRIIVGGAFRSIGNSTQNCLARINPDGTFDTSFKPVIDGWVRTVVLQDDGKIMISGEFNKVNGTTISNNFARLNIDGSLDTSVNLGLIGHIRAVTIQRDGNNVRGILLGGSLKGVTGISNCNGIARMNIDGSLDTLFCTKMSANYPDVAALEIQSDGMIIAGGKFIIEGGIGRKNLARFYENGFLDSTFSLQTDDYVFRIAILP